MRHFSIAGLIIVFFAFTATAIAQTTTVQGPAAATATAKGNPVLVGGADADGKVQRAYVDGTSRALSVNVAARLGGKTSEWCVTSASAATLTAFANRKAVEIQNLGPNAIFCTVDGQTPLSTGALGRKIAATDGTWTLDAGADIVIKCIAAAAPQATPACTQVTELR
jgi:hypothetical protein